MLNLRMRSGSQGKIAVSVAVLLVVVYLVAVYSQWIDVHAYNLTWARRSQLLSGLEALAVAAAGVLLGTSVQRGATEAAERDAGQARERAARAEVGDRESLAMRAVISAKVGALAAPAVDVPERFSGAGGGYRDDVERVRDALNEVLAAADAVRDESAR